MKTYAGWCRVLGLLALAGTLEGQERGAADHTRLTETEKIRHLLSRFSFGPTEAMVERVRTIGMDAWFERQLRGDLPEPEALGARLAGMRSLSMDGAGLLRSFRTRLAKKPTAAQRREYARLRSQPRNEVRDAVLTRAVYGANRLREASADFFRNHFNVDVNKGDVRFLVPDWDREVVRAEALSSFGRMLEKSAKHPAMLIYLDNALSRRPLSKAELRTIEINTRIKTGSRERGVESSQIAKQRGLNENYARELLELHTLGVDHYYTQRDVIEVARALTGWTVQLDPKHPVGFRFRADLHCRGEKRFLGGAIKAPTKNLVAEGETVLRRLERHPGTARFLAFKLCRWFVDDDPPEAMVKRIARVFRSSKGKLQAVYRAIYRDPEFFAPSHFQSKFKRPFEFVVSALRVTGAEIRSTKRLHAVLAELSEPIYECEDPTGYFDQAEAWRDPGVMAVRWRFATDLVRGRVAGVTVPAAFYAGLHPRIPRVWVDQMAARILPAGMSAQTRAVLDRVVRAHLAEKPRPEVLGPLIAGLLLGSPEFQRQ